MHHHHDDCDNCGSSIFIFQQRKWMQCENSDIRVSNAMSHITHNHITTHCDASKKYRCTITMMIVIAGVPFSFSNNGCNVTIVTSGRVSNVMSLFLSHLMKYDTIVVLDYGTHFITVCHYKPCVQSSADRFALRR